MSALTLDDYRNMGTFLSHVLDGFKVGSLDKDQASGSLNAVMAALANHDDDEARKWFVDYRERLGEAPKGRLTVRIREYPVRDGCLIVETIPVDEDGNELAPSFQVYAPDGAPLGGPCGSYAAAETLLGQLVKARNAWLLSTTCRVSQSHG
jgi:hypothetical protein